jgi:hypothetical protein
MKEMPSGDFDGSAAQEQDSRIDPKNRWDRERVPVGNIVVARIEVAGILPHKKSADQRYKKHEIACKREKKTEPIASQ